MRPNPHKHKSSEVASKPQALKLVSESSDSFEPVDLSSSSYLCKDPQTETAGRKDLVRMQTKREFAFLYRPATNGNLLQVVRRRQFPPATLKEIGTYRLQTAAILSNRSLAIEENDETPAQQAKINCKFPYQSSIIPPKRCIKRWGSGTTSQPNSPERRYKRGKLIRASVPIPVDVVKQSPRPLFVFRRPKRSLQRLEIPTQTCKDLSISPIPRKKSQSLHHFPHSASHSHPPTSRFTAKTASKDPPIALESPKSGFNEVTFDPLSQSEARRLVEKAKTLLSLEVSRRHKGNKRPLTDLRLLQYAS